MDFAQQLLHHTLTIGVLFVSSLQLTADERTEFTTAVKPILKEYCFGCHGAETSERDINLSTLQSWRDLEKSPRLLEQLVSVLQKNVMPPEDSPQPSTDQRKTLTEELEATFERVARSQPVTPFRLRRMNRFEYGNAVRDLFQLRSWVYSINDRIIRDHNDYFRPETGKMPEVVVVGNRIMGLQQLLENRLLGVMAFPKDPPAENGFNNRGDHLSLSPVLMQAFMELSRSVVNAENFDQNCGVWENLFEDPNNPRPVERLVKITDRDAMVKGSGVTISAWIKPAATPDSWQTIVRREDDWRRQLLSIGRTGDIWGLWMGAGIAGRYLEFGAPVDPALLGDGKWHHVAGTFDGHRMNLYVDGKPVGSQTEDGELYTASNRQMEVGSYGGREPFRGDLKSIRLFRSGLKAEQIKQLAEGADQTAHNELVGSWKTPDVVPSKPTQSVTAIAHDRIRNFLRRAFRSPADEKTLRLYTRYFDKRYLATEDFTQSMKDVVSGALASPRFMHVHNEQDAKLPNRDAFNLATRLSFFLWSSIPDDDLLGVAEESDLFNPEELSYQVDRMMSDRRVKNFCDSFAPQWLKINNLVSASPDFKTYREYYFGGDDKISYKRGMHMMLEPLLNFETVFVENRPIIQLVDADFSYRSHLLSEWYEGRAATYPINVNLRHIEFTRTPLDDRRYGGVVTTSAVMVMTSSPHRSLPITRGSWVSSVIFNDPPEPPPDNVPDLRADDSTLEKENLTVRQKLKAHSSNAQCAGCHKKIDTLGFALENYDLLGRWRDRYRTGLAVDASGTLFGKHDFRDIVEFKDAVRSEQDLFAVAFIRHLLSYALGRELTLADRNAAVEIARACRNDDYKMRDVIRNIVLHPVFTQKDAK